MKKKTFFLICLLSGVGFLQVFAQNDKNATGSFQEHLVYNDWGIPVFCNGQQVDLLIATIQIHHIGHYLKGNWLWCKFHAFGNAVSTNGSGEVFSVQEIDKQVNNIQPDGSWEWIDAEHVNLKGDKGTHYIGTLIFYYTGEVQSIRAICK